MISVRVPPVCWIITDKLQIPYSPIYPSTITHPTKHLKTHTAHATHPKQPQPQLQCGAASHAQRSRTCIPKSPKAMEAHQQRYQHGPGCATVFSHATVVACARVTCTNWLSVLLPAWRRTEQVAAQLQQHPAAQLLYYDISCLLPQDRIGLHTSAV